MNANPLSIAGGGGGGGGGGNGGFGGAGSVCPPNPTTYNCIPVTGGSNYPVSIPNTGGRINISWNPQ
jgi:hypothetical protein